MAPSSTAFSRLLLGRQADAAAQRATVPGYRPDIDGLRAFAVVAVIVNHVNRALLPGGYLGVDLFFVISGFVITESLAARRETGLLDFLTGFYVRRVKRLLPALLVYVLVVSALLCLVIPGGQAMLETAQWALVGFANVSLYNAATDYFATASELHPFTQTWSLGVEEQFYLVFPLLLWCSGFIKGTGQGRRNLLLLVGGCSIASLAAFVGWYATSPSAAYFLLPARFWEMAAGCLIAVGLRCNPRLGVLLGRIPPLLLLLAMLAVMAMPLDLAVAATLAVVLLCVVLIASLGSGGLGFGLLTHPSVVAIGLISYSLYLWHWGVLSLSRWTLGLHWWSLPLQILLMLLLAASSYRWIEQPARQATWFRRRWPTLALGGAAVLSSAAVVGAMGGASARVFAGDSVRGDAIYAERTAWRYDACRNAWSAQGLHTAADLGRCWLRVGQRKPIDPAGARRRVFVYGNSYVEHLSPALAAVAQRRPDLPIHVYAATGCTASTRLGFKGESRIGHCAGVMQHYLDWFWTQSRPGDVLLLANSVHYFSQLPRDGSAAALQLFWAGAPTTSRAALAAYQQELGALSDALQRRRRRLLLASAIPVLAGNPDICAQWYAAWNDQCSRDRLFEPRTTAENARIGRFLADSAASLRTVDLLGPLLDRVPRSARPFDLYFNKDHLSIRGALALRDRLEASLLRP